MSLAKYRIGKVYISATTPSDAEQRIVALAKSGRADYICVSNVRTVTMANRDAAYCEVMNQAAMCLPDGMPLVWMARLWGLKSVQRTVGPDLFVRMIQCRENGLTHFLLGDTQETLQAMCQRFGDGESAPIAGTYSPPFCDLDEYDYPAIADQINQSKADIVWLSLRAPKQDFFAVRLMPYLDRAICIGVGAAFRFSLGEISHPPKWVQKLGLTGLFWRKKSLGQIGWYIKHMAILLVYGVDIIIERIFGKREKLHQ